MIYHLYPHIGYTLYVNKWKKCQQTVGRAWPSMGYGAKKLYTWNDWYWERILQPVQDQTTTKIDG